MNLEKDTAPTGLYNYLPKTRRRTAWQRKTGLKGIGPLKKGLLKKVGYSPSASATRRHAAVKRAVKKYGRASTIRKLNAVAVYTRKRAPKTSRKFKADMKFAQKMKGGVGTVQELQELLNRIDKKQLEISGNPAYGSTDPAVVRAYDTLRKDAEGLGVVVERGVNLGNLRTAVEVAHQKAMNLPQ